MPDTDTPAGGGRRVDILRRPVALPAEVTNALHVFELANRLPADHGWPLRIDWAASSITYWPPTAPGEPPYTQTLIQPPRGRLWPALLEARAVWCADPAHTRPAWECPYQLDHTGEHAAQDDAGAQTNAHAELVMTRAIEHALTAVLDHAGRTCEHPDPGAPIYDSVRGCVPCAVAALMKLMAGPTPAEQAARERLRSAMTGGLLPAGHWVVGQGFVPAGDPRLTVSGTWPTA